MSAFCCAYAKLEPSMSGNVSSDREQLGWGVDRLRADEDVAVDPPSKQLVRRLDVIDGVGDAVDDGVEVEVADGAAQLAGLRSIGAEPADLRWQRIRRDATVQHRDLMAPLQQHLDGVPPNELRAADHEDSHTHAPAIPDCRARSLPRHSLGARSARRCASALAW